MAAAGTANYTALSNFVERAALAVAEPCLTISKFGKKITVPEKNSKTVKFKRVERLAPTKGADAATIKSVVEGVVPSDVNPTETVITVSLNQYGNVSRLTDVASWINEVDVDQEVVKRNAENMVQTNERVYWAGIIGGSQVFRLTDEVGGVSGAARVNVAGRINAAALDKAIRALQRADAKYITDGISASNKISTAGVRAGYVAVIHPDVKYDLERVPGFVPVAQYGEMKGVFDHEVGSYKEIRFVWSTLAQVFPDAGAAVSGTYSTTGTNNDVYPVMIFGKDAYAAIDLASASQTYYIPKTQADHANPLGQYSTIGWKSLCASVILNDNWLLRFECAVSA